MKASSEGVLEVNNVQTSIPVGDGVISPVDGVSFSILRGQTLVIAGESGCGKSVLCKTIMGLLPPNGVLGKGSSILVNGRQLVGLRERSFNTVRATQMAMIFQNPLSSLHPTTNVGRQIAEPLVHHREISYPQAKKMVIELIGSVGLPQSETCYELFPHQLSGGMRQRVAIAIALACSPDLLIADEPTTALDVTVQAGILTLLKLQQKERGMSLLLVTHDLRVAYHMADHIAVMYAGKIVGYAPVRQLFSNARHHYTKALIGSVSQINNSSDHTLQPIAGQPCAFHDLPSGCRFAPRCPGAINRCHHEEPSLQSCGKGEGMVSCWSPFRGIFNEKGPAYH